MSKRKGRHKPERRARDVHVFLGNSVRDQGLAVASCRQDAAADRAWFQAHPTQPLRVRPASVLEMGAFGLPPGSTVEITRTSSGCQIRRFRLPQA